MANEGSEEVERLRAQLAALEANRGGGFRGGFFGCFGVLAAIVAVLVGLVVLAGLGNASKDRRLADGAAQPADLLTMCVPVARAAMREVPAAGKLEAGIEPPTITSHGPPPEIVCILGSRRGDVSVSARILCMDPLNPACAKIVSVRRGGRWLM